MQTQFLFACDRIAAACRDKALRMRSASCCKCEMTPASHQKMLETERPKLALLLKTDRAAPNSAARSLANFKRSGFCAVANAWRDLDDDPAALDKITGRKKIAVLDAAKTQVAHFQHSKAIDTAA